MSGPVGSPEQPEGRGRIGQHVSGAAPAERAEALAALRDESRLVQAAVTTLLDAP
ncbi:hypothetical protein QOZ88_18875 [Blastococcus sp. BMG 814]|uniref:Uncharacterized protein n=1 Tax=Blastococcus carthaginiensis TaxID=3050034 RepID=A0ABT9IGN5_9ACTN|nr:hypothetical protein [Blastococcus carthaginiensis]MDP5184706.1 hypothetical protein [Blastococcus carthaginiensis]